MITWTWRVYWLGLFVIMHLPKPPGAELTARIGDKVVHAGAYFVLACLGGWSARRRGCRLNRRWLGRWWLIYAVYAALDELLQAIPSLGRACELGDWLADLTGMTAALVLLWAFGGQARNRALAE
ncbi:MAG: VanZ family protein [Phycisphaerae bacterium]